VGSLFRKHISSRLPRLTISHHYHHQHRHRNHHPIILTIAVIVIIIVFNTVIVITFSITIVIITIISQVISAIIITINHHHHHPRCLGVRVIMFLRLSFHSTFPRGVTGTAWPDICPPTAWASKSLLFRKGFLHSSFPRGADLSGKMAGLNIFTSQLGPQNHSFSPPWYEVGSSSAIIRH
jgi:hypothetical protein